MELFVGVGSYIISQVPEIANSAVKLLQSAGVSSWVSYAIYSIMAGGAAYLVFKTPQVSEEPENSETLTQHLEQIVQYQGPNYLVLAPQFTNSAAGG